MPNLADQIRKALAMLQGYVNDAAQTRDLDDIRALVQVHSASLDMIQLQEYFALFNQQRLLHELI